MGPRDLPVIRQLVANNFFVINYNVHVTFSRETNLLYDEKLSSPIHKERIVEVVAHEMVSNTFALLFFSRKSVRFDLRMFEIDLQNVLFWSLYIRIRKIKTCLLILIFEQKAHNWFGNLVTMDWWNDSIDYKCHKLYMELQSNMDVMIYSLAQRRIRFLHGVYRS